MPELTQNTKTLPSPKDQPFTGTVYDRLASVRQRLISCVGKHEEFYARLDGSPLSGGEDDMEPQRPGVRARTFDLLDDIADLLNDLENYSDTLESVA